MPRQHPRLADRTPWAMGHWVGNDGRTHPGDLMDRASQRIAVITTLAIRRITGAARR